MTYFSVHALDAPECHFLIQKEAVLSSSLINYSLSLSRRSDALQPYFFHIKEIDNW